MTPSLILTPPDHGLHVKLAGRECTEPWVAAVLSEGSRRMLPITVHVNEDGLENRLAARFFTQLGHCSDWLVEVRNTRYTGDPTPTPHFSVANVAEAREFPRSFNPIKLIKFVKPVVARAFVLTSPYYEEFMARLREVTRAYNLELVRAPDFYLVAERLLVNREERGDYYCPCDPSRVCPCEEGVKEALRWGRCSCNLLCRRPCSDLSEEDVAAIVSAIRVLRSAAAAQSRGMCKHLVYQAMKRLLIWLAKS